MSLGLATFFWIARYISRICLAGSLVAGDCLGNLEMKTINVSGQDMVFRGRAI
jgi:hypothetical protein